MGLNSREGKATKAILWRMILSGTETTRLMTVTATTTLKTAQAKSN